MPSSSEVRPRIVLRAPPFSLTRRPPPPLPPTATEEVEVVSSGAQTHQVPELEPKVDQRQTPGDDRTD